MAAGRGALAAWLGSGAKPPSSRTRGAAGSWAGVSKIDALDVELEALDGFFDQVSVLVADVFELRGGDAHVEGFLDHAGEACRLQPGFEGLPVDLFFERAEDAHPLVQHGGGRRDE